jgi:arylsulfatase A-like enzyme
MHRGFDTTFGFLVGGEDHYTQDASWSTNCSEVGVNKKSLDLWDNGSPAVGRTGRNKTDDTRYNGYTFTERAVDLIQAHNTSTPFFLYFALHNTHGPIEAPQKYIDLYNFSFHTRNVFNAMVSVVDDSVKNVTTALKAKDMWSTALFIWATDNGTPVQTAGSNHPLRGGKGSNWYTHSWQSPHHTSFSTTPPSSFFPSFPFPTPTHRHPFLSPYPPLPSGKVAVVCLVSTFSVWPFVRI